jgi:hypothetical protein
MNTMHALRFFLLVISGVACTASAAVWVMLYFLRKKVHALESIKAEREARKAAAAAYVEMVPH